MAKRISIIICILVLLLSACSKPGTTASDSENSSVTPNQTIAGGQADTQTPAVDSESPDTETPTDHNTPETDYPFDPNIVDRSVTAGGYKVHTDPSHYTPYRPPESKYVRPEGVDLSEFHPENANGKVYPYASETLYSSYEGGYSGTAGYKYGFFDETGTLVTDGIYTECAPLMHWEYESDTRTIYPFWLVSRAGEVKRVHYEGNGYSYDYPEGSILHGVVAMDGSFSIPCEFRGISVYDDRMICARDYSTGDFVVYDFNGKLILTTKHLFDSSANWVDISYGEGLYVIGNMYDNRSEWYYLTEAGDHVLGPYQRAGSFANGLACVSTDGEHVGFIDKSGDWVIPPRYTYCSGFMNGIAFASDDSRMVVIDTTGNEIIQTSFNNSKYFTRQPCGFRLSDMGNYSEYYDNTGNLLLSGYGDWYCLSQDLFFRAQGSNVIVHSLDDNVPDLTVPGIQTLRKGYAYVDGKPQEGFISDDFTNLAITFVPEDLSTWYLLEDQEMDYYTGLLGCTEIYDEVTGERYIVCKSGGKTLVFNSAMEQIYSGDSSSLNIVDGMVMDQSGICCTYRTLEGELLFSFPYQGGGD